MRPSEVRLIPDLLQYLVDWDPKHLVNRLDLTRLSLIAKVCLGPVFPCLIEMVILPVVEALCLSLTLCLVIFHPFMLVYPLHQLSHVPSKPYGEGLLQVRLSGQPVLEGVYRHILKVLIQLVV